MKKVKNIITKNEYKSWVYNEGGFKIEFLTKEQIESSGQAEEESQIRLVTAGIMRGAEVKI